MHSTSDQLMSTHLRSPEHSQGWGSSTEVLGSPDHGCGTICPLNCNSTTFASPSLGGYLRHFWSLRLGALWLLCFNGAGYKHLLTYYRTEHKITLMRLFSPENGVDFWRWFLERVLWVLGNANIKYEAQIIHIRVLNNRRSDDIGAVSVYLPS